MRKGFTLVELLVVIAILGIAFAVGFSGCMNNRGATEDRAKDAAAAFAQENNIQIKRLSCAGDSDGDGYGTCMLVAMDGEKINLQCPCNWGDTAIWGANGCKEIDGLYKQSINVRGNGVVQKR